ncbi:ferredoxin [Streptomyces glomeratus]|uniref:Ferredoxin n=1 Tax=Streptomyces glomeratus TaxID=284452 RepID=A0ABP6LRD2_9ACTN|nr:ferredoxin [Streptomyces glomeratus]MCF1512431.1 ferredoxin [Streptomyces glomeratus]
MSGGARHFAVRTAKCAGYGICAGIAPEVFTVDDQGYGRGPSGAVPAGLVELARRAADECPMAAIAEVTEPVRPAE